MNQMKRFAPLAFVALALSLMVALPLLSVSATDPIGAKLAAAATKEAPTMISNIAGIMAFAMCVPAAISALLLAAAGVRRWAAVLTSVFSSLGVLVLGAAVVGAMRQADAIPKMSGLSASVGAGPMIALIGFVAATGVALWGSIAPAKRQAA